MHFLAAAVISILGNPPDCLRVEMVRAEGLEPPHLSTTGPKPAASTNSATRADAVGGAAYNRRVPFGKAGGGQPAVLARVPERGEPPMQQPEPNEPPTTPSPAPAQPSQPGQPAEPPPGIPTHTPDIDVPSPPSPGTNPTPGPISPVG
jgi:hypothetical protein